MLGLTHNHLFLFLVQAVLIISSSRSLGLLGRRLGQPMVVAEIAAGVLLGPSFLGWLAPRLSATIFAPGSLALLGTMSQVGLALFMFLVGLELDPRLLRGRGRAAVAISQSSILLPFALAVALSVYLHPRLAPAGVPLLSFALFMGAALSVTAFPVLARILAERRHLGSRLGALAVTCAAVNDVTAWCVLAFLLSFVRGSGLPRALLTTASAAAYIAVMIFLVRPFLARLGARAAGHKGLTQDKVAGILLLLLLSSCAAELIGVHAIFGAFLMGAIMPRGGPLGRAVAERLEDLVVVFLLPLFFAYSGLRTHAGLLSGGAEWALCGLIFVVACAGKLGGSAVAARLSGLSWREASAVGVLMNTRGLIELVILNIGLDMGVISPTLFTMMVLMALATTLMTTPLLQRIYPSRHFPLEVLEGPPAPAPPPPVEGPGVMLCVSYERAGLGMVPLCKALLGAGAGRAFALTLVRPTDRPSFYLGDDPRGEAATVLAPVLERALALRLPIRPLSLVSDEPGQDICRVAEAKDVNLILLGRHKPLLGQSMLAGTAREVIRHTTADVGILIDRGLGEVRRVLVPFAGTLQDLGAVRLARRLTGEAGVRVTVLHVADPVRGAAHLAVDRRVEEIFREPGPAPELTAKVVQDSSPVTAALAEAAQGYDLVLVSAGREWGFSSRPFGLHPEALVRWCPTSILVVQRGAGR